MRYSLISRLPRWPNLFWVLVFIYFLTVSMELVHIWVVLWKLKLNHFIALFLCGIQIFVVRRIYLPQYFMAPLIGIVISLILSSFFSPVFERSMGYLVVYIFSGILFFILPMNWILSSDKDFILKIYWGAFFVIFLFSIMQKIGFHTWPGVPNFFINVEGRIRCCSYEPSAYALYATACTFFFNTYLLLDSHFHQWKWVVVGNLGLLVSLSTGGFFSYGIYIGVLTLLLLFAKKIQRDFPGFRQRVTRFLLVISGLGIVGCITFSQVFRRFFLKFFFEGWSHGSFVERFDGIIRAVDSFKASPLFGKGLGGVGPYSYLQKMNIEKIPFGTSLVVYEPYDPTNVLTELLGSLGMVGGILFGWLLWRGVRFIHKSYRMTPVLREKQVLFSLAISLIVVLLEMQFNPGFFRSYVWLHVSVLLGYAAKIQQERTS